MKKCVHCGVEKSLTEFYKQTTSRDGRGSWCKVCNVTNAQAWAKVNRDRRSAHVMKDRHKIVVPDYQEQLEKQQGVCAICEAQDADRRLGWDHCHRTNLVRGLLCRRCNIGLGMYLDDPALLRRAADYLENPPIVDC